MSLVEKTIKITKITTPKNKKEIKKARHKKGNKYINEKLVKFPFFRKYKKFF